MRQGNRLDREGHYGPSIDTTRRVDIGEISAQSKEALSNCGGCLAAGQGKKCPSLERHWRQARLGLDVDVADATGAANGSGKVPLTQGFYRTCSPVLIC